MEGKKCLVTDAYRSPGSPYDFHQYHRGGWGGIAHYCWVVVKVQAPKLAFSDTTTGGLEGIPHYCQVSIEIMLPTWLLLTVVGVSMVSSSGVFWSRAFIVEIKFLSC